VAGVDYRYLALCAALGCVLGLGFIAMKPYRLARFIDFADKDHKVINKIDPKGHILAYSRKTAATSDPGYQQLQSKIAVGSGGVFGAGLMGSRQKLLFLPEAHTDFIYAVVAEETGMFGALLMLLGFVVILWRGIRTYIRAEDNFGRYLALSVCVCVVVQAMMNMSVVLGLLPNKGIPLPSTLLLMGMLLSVSESAA
jgi:cell division protein FtsW